jgi:choice-of-anchor B domain-containing protein
MYKILPILFFFLFTVSTNAQLGNHNMVLLKHLDDHTPPPGTYAWNYSALWGYTAPDGREYVILGCVTGSSFVDITDSLDIHEVAFFPVDSINPGNLWRETKTFSHYAYVITSSPYTGLEIYDLQYLPDSVVFKGRHFFPGKTYSHSISANGPYLFLNGGSHSGITVIDLSDDPLNPVQRGTWDDLFVHDCEIRDDTIWASTTYDLTLTVIDANNKDSLNVITSWQTLPNPRPHNSALTSDRKYAFTTDEVFHIPEAGRLKVWNIQDLNNIIFVRDWHPTGIPNTVVHNVEIYGDTAVVSHHQAGVRVLDISDPENPFEFAWYDTYPSSNSNEFGKGCWEAYMFPSGKIAASDMQTGLYVLKIGNSVGITNNNGLVEGFELKQNYPNPFNPSTEITFSIPKNSEVTLKVYDVNGKEVAELINRNYDRGTHNITFDAAKYELSSGIYFYTLTAGDLKETKKMLMVK